MSGMQLKKEKLFIFANTWPNRLIVMHIYSYQGMSEISTKRFVNFRTIQREMKKGPS